MLIDYRFIVVARVLEDDVEDSIWKNIIDRIYELELHDFFKITKEKITCSITGAFIIPFGIANNPGKIKSLEACDILLIEEAEEVQNYAWDKIIPTIRDDNGKKVSIITIYNPDWENGDTHQLMTVNQDKLLLGRFIRHINYLDNPFCPENILVDAEQMKQDDYKRYKHIYLGIAKETTEIQVFYEVWDVKALSPNEIETDSRHHNYRGRIKEFAGVAFGNSQTPTSALMAFEYDGDLYISRSASGVEELEGMADIVRQIDKKLVYCQPEQPATRRNINKLLTKDGIKLIDADKGKDDVLDSIKFLRGSYGKIYIHPDCQNVIDDFTNYFWEVDKHTNEILDVPVDKHNQSFHALRHALHAKIGIGE